MLYHDLDEKEVADFKKWARENYEAYTVIKGVWHPVIQAECAKINAEVDKEGI